MSSQFSNMKKLPYIPPMSPPPIDSLPEEADYEIPDYDITGLSQKLCEEESSIGHEPLGNTVDCLDITVENSNINFSTLINSDFCTKKEDSNMIENIVKSNSEEESSSSITIPPLDCEGQSLNECNISDLENDVCENYIEQCNSPVTLEANSNDLEFEIKTKSEWPNSVANESLYQEDCTYNDYYSREENLSESLDKEPEVYQKGIDKLISSSNSCSVNAVSENREHINELETNLVEENHSCSKNEHEKSKSDLYNEENLSSNLVYDGDDADGGITKDEINQSATKREEDMDNNDDDFGNFASKSQSDMENDDFGDFISEVTLDNNNILEQDIEKSISEKEIHNKNDEVDRNKLVYEESLKKEENNTISIISKESFQDTNEHIFEESVSDVQFEIEDEDFGTFVYEKENKDADDDVDKDKENVNNISNIEVVNEDKFEADFGNFDDKAENDVNMEKYDDLTSKVVSSDKCDIDNDDEFGDFISEKENKFGVEDDFGDFNSTNIAEELQSEVKICQENYHDEYLDPILSFSSPMKASKYSSSNENESKEERKESLQLEFSDDEDEILEKDTSKEFCEVDNDTIPDPDLKDNKFHWFVVRWLPNASDSSKSGSFLKFSKLVELVDGSLIWYHVANVESCSALKFSWANSRINKLYLSSLNVDTRNILLGHRSKWISTIPIFAQALSFSPLTPLKPSSSSVSWSMEKGPVNSENIEPNVSFGPEGGGNPIKRDLSQDLQPIPDSKNIPPVQFDWNSSGLTNPLNIQEKAILSSLEKDFTTVSTPPQEFKSSNSLIEEALKKANYNSNPNSSLTDNQSSTVKDTESLPPKVQQILKRVPDLNFMQSKVLAFPISKTVDFRS